MCERPVLILFLLYVTLLAVQTATISDYPSARWKRRPEMDTNGFYGDTFSSGFGDFYTAKKRRPEMDTNGFYGDTFSSGFGDFYTARKRTPTHPLQTKYKSFPKRRPEMDTNGFYGDTFSSGFGDFYTAKRTPTNLGQIAQLINEDQGQTKT